jgi:hypothetical protein
MSPAAKSPFAAVRNAIAALVGYAPTLGGLVLRRLGA